MYILLSALLYKSCSSSMVHVRLVNQNLKDLLLVSARPESFIVFFFFFRPEVFLLFCFRPKVFLFFF